MYYPRSSFFGANLGNNLSFVWRSLWKSRKVLNMDCRCSIVEGRKIKVMTEPWLRGLEEVYLGSPQGQRVYNITINDLMLANVKRWDAQKIKHLFSQEVANEILKVPLGEDVQRQNCL